MRILAGFYCFVLCGVFPTRSSSSLWKISDTPKLTNSHGEQPTRRVQRQEGGLFGHFAAIDHDLEESYLPNQISGRLEVVAMPPSKEKGRLQCPQCLQSLPDILPKLYCSSKLSAKVRFLSKHQLEVLEDMSPGSNTTRLRTWVTYTAKTRCQCHLMQQDSKQGPALMVVTPPRQFSLRSIQILHLDDSFTFLPWNETEPFLRSLPKSLSSCYQTLTGT